MSGHNHLEPSQHGLALTIGIAGHCDTSLNLPEAVRNDATDMASLLIETCGFRADKVRTLVDREATLEQIRNDLNWLAKTAGQEHLVVIMFSGHGDTTADGGVLCPADFDRDAAGSGLGHAELARALDAIDSGRLILIVDACHAANMARIKAFGGRPLDSAPFVQMAHGRATRPNHRIVMVSSLSHQQSHADEAARNSFFIGAVLDGMRGKARSTEGMILYGSVFTHAAEAVGAFAADQTPKTDATADFPIALQTAFTPRRFKSDWKERAHGPFEVLDLGHIEIRDRQDPVEAYRLAHRPELSARNRLICLRAAAALKHGQACFELGRAARAGLNGSPVEAEQWWQEGAAFGDADCAFQLWKMLKGTAATADMAREFLEAAASAGSSEAKVELAGVDLESDSQAVRKRAFMTLTGLASDPALLEIQMKAKFRLAMLAAKPAGWAYDRENALRLVAEILQSGAAPPPLRDAAGRLSRHLGVVP